RISLDRRRGDERSRSRPEVERRKSPVRVAVLLAEILVQAGCKGSAEDRVHHDQREIILGETRDTDPPDPDFRLRRAGLVYQVDLAGRHLADWRQRRARWRGAGPFPEKRFQ